MRAVSARLASWRRRALAYRYDYDPRFHLRLVDDIATRYGADLSHPDPDRRRLARAAAHYEAQLALRPRVSIWAFEIASVFALPLFLVAALLCGLLLLKRRQERRPCEAVRLVFPGRFAVNPEIFLIPPEVKGFVVTRPLKGMALWPSDVQFILGLLAGLLGRRTPFPLQFALKCAVDLGQVRAALAGLAPTCLLVYWEFNCALTPVAWRLAREGIATHNVMHGDKTVFAKHGLFEADRCYCWNAAYVELFRRLHARADFRIFANPAFRLSAAESAELLRRPPEAIGLVVPALVTLGKSRAEQDAAVAELAAACNVIATGQRLTVRPHPFYPEEFDALRPHLSPDVAVVMPDAEPPRAFILRHAVLIGTASTMLLEAAEIGCQVVVVRTPGVAASEPSQPITCLPTVTVSAIDELPETIRRLSAAAKVSIA